MFFYPLGNYAEDMDIQKILTENIKKRRIKLGLSQSGLAKQLNISIKHMNHIEKGRKFPSPALLNRICDVLTICPSQLFSDRGPVDIVEILDKQVRQGINREIDRIRDIYAGVV